MTHLTARDREQRPGRGQEYAQAVRTLSEASVAVHFDAFGDIDWDDPEFAVAPDDERWILGEEDPLGRHPWYQALPRERRIEIGLYRWALISKIGLQFEQVLIGGIMANASAMQNANPEFRYALHEATEECHHVQMFQEFVNRTGLDVPGAHVAFRRLMPVLSAFGRWAPAIFWVGVLAGEEPIDHLQKSVLRRHTDLHPLMERIMSIHVAEEARHIGFAHHYLTEHVPRLGTVDRALVGLLTPVVMRLLGDVIMKPSKQAREAMGIPDEVADEIWWDSTESRATLRDLYADVRMLTDRVGLRNRLTRPLWKRLGIDGRPARFRSEPSPVAS